MRTSLLISTYNWPQALELVLRSVQEQIKMPDEILLADDGSGEETAVLIKSFIEKDLPIKHVWQEDQGFRRTSILNKAVAKSEADYIVQIDGDCMLHPNFLLDHLNNLKENRFLFGSRVNIREEALEQLFKLKNTEIGFFSRSISRRTRNLHLPFLTAFYKETAQLSKKVRGCNLSFWRKDFLAINGYNEDMTGWGKEDSEMVVRLLNRGVNGKRLRYGGIIYHIWHKECSRSKKCINEEIQQETIDKGLTFCKNGIDKYL
ncbi:glycosyltransferase family 2 protein [Salinimicrobium tongyeongense]|uniref:Glycosyltransferase family 2 protein n=1 Tax=Salinimicrobium tongyeongense TaxID=2809707 RepID=A0ABY6NPN7_9FLAO|nr:glycosyltransferase family 2 protein [Salinimicrobium tongyeongense]UZH54832.1 glycosyltransferase family 2 protein [Salinimicrobium tongyeongense]